MKALLQKMYDDANWYGYATRKGKQYHSYKISQIANRLNISLDYNCPA
jgi:hypothetical protein